jgi:hypothetical protein
MEERERKRETVEEGKLAVAGDLEAAREKSMDEKLDTKTEDPFLVEWNGKDDPENPLNFKTRRKVLIMVVIAAIAFLTYHQLLLH